MIMTGLLWGLVQSMGWGKAELDILLVEGIDHIVEEDGLVDFHMKDLTSIHKVAELDIAVHT